MKQNFNNALYVIRIVLAALVSVAAFILVLLIADAEGLPL